MKRVVISSCWFPVSISQFFRSALEHREDIELLSVGPFTGTSIPWAGGMELPEKYAIPPTIPLAKHLWNVGHMNSAFLFQDKRLEDVDLWIQCDSTFYFEGRVPAKKIAHIAVDPHVINYDQQRLFADYFFNMQKVYSKPNDIYLPYCASKYHHYPMDIPKEYDVCLVGLQYPQRNELIAALRREGISVFYALGLGPDEYREAYNKARVAVSWSSLDDLIARVFEAGAFKLPLVCNRVTDLPLHFDERYHYLGFNTVGEAVEQVKSFLSNPDLAQGMAGRLHEEVMSKHLYDDRIDQIFDTIGL